MSHHGAYIAIQDTRSFHGDDGTVQRREEIVSSEVHKCPIKHLILVLQSGAEVSLKSHQKSFVRKFRANVEDGTEDSNGKSNVVSYSFHAFEEGHQKQKHPPGVYLYRGRSGYVYQIKPSAEYMKYLRQKSHVAFLLSLARQSSERAKLDEEARARGGVGEGECPIVMAAATEARVTRIITEYLRPHEIHKGVKMFPPLEYETEQHRRVVMRMSTLGTGVYVGDHFKKRSVFSTRTYHDCFRGKDAISWLLASADDVQSHEHATSYCQEILSRGFVQSSKRALEIERLIEEEKGRVARTGDEDATTPEHSALQRSASTPDQVSRGGVNQKTLRPRSGNVAHQATSEGLDHYAHTRTQRAFDAVSHSLRKFAKPSQKAFSAFKRSVSRLTKKRHFSVTPATVAKLQVLSNATRSRSNTSLAPVPEPLRKSQRQSEQESFLKCVATIAKRDPKQLKFLLTTLCYEVASDAHTTLLHAACSIGCMGCVQVLLTYLVHSGQRESIMLRNESGVTSSELALQKKHVAIAKAIHAKQLGPETFDENEFYRFLIGPATPNPIKPISTENKVARPTDRMRVPRQSKSLVVHVKNKSPAHNNLKGRSTTLIVSRLRDRISDLDNQEVLRRCKEIQDSQVNQCPVHHLRMVLEEGTSVPLREHQRNAIVRFRARVEEGAAGVTRVNKFKVLWFNFPSDGREDYPPGVYLYRASNDFVHQIMPSEEYMKHLRQKSHVAFLLSLARQSSERAKLDEEARARGGVGEGECPVVMAAATEARVTRTILDYLYYRAPRRKGTYKHFMMPHGFKPDPSVDFSEKTESSVRKVIEQLNNGTFDFSQTPAREDVSLRNMFFIRSDSRTTDPQHPIYCRFVFCPDDSEHQNLLGDASAASSDADRHRRMVIRMSRRGLENGGIYVGDHFKKRSVFSTRTYHDCFRGKDAIAWMIKYQKDIETKHKAITHGTMMLHYGYIQSSDRALEIKRLIEKETKAVQDYHNNNYKRVLTRWLRDINLAKYKDAFLEKIMAPSDFKLFSDKELQKMKMSKTEISRFKAKAFAPESTWDLRTPEEQLAPTDLAHSQQDFRDFKVHTDDKKTVLEDPSISDGGANDSFGLPMAPSGMECNATASKEAIPNHLDIPLNHAHALPKQKRIMRKSARQLRVTNVPTREHSSFWKCYQLIANRRPQQLKVLLSVLKYKATSFDQTTLLHAACHAGCMACVRVLLNYLVETGQRESIMQENDFGITSSELALYKKQFAMAELIRSKSMEEEIFKEKKFYRFLIGPATPDPAHRIVSDGKQRLQRASTQPLHEFLVAARKSSVVTQAPREAKWDKCKPNPFLLHKVLVASAFKKLWGRYCSKVKAVCSEAERFSGCDAKTSISYFDYHQIVRESARGRNIDFPYRGSLMPEHCTVVDHIGARGINCPHCCNFHYRDENDVVEFFKDILTHKEKLDVNTKVLVRDSSDPDNFLPGKVVIVHSEGTYTVRLDRSGNQIMDVPRHDIKGPKLCSLEQNISTSNIMEQDKPSTRFLETLDLAGIDNAYDRVNALNAVNEAVLKPAYLDHELRLEFLNHLQKGFKNFKQGKCVLKRGAKSGRFFILVRGKAKLLTYTSGAQKTHSDMLVLHIGAWFSKYGLLKGDDRAVVAGKGGCCVMSVDEAFFRKCLKRCPSLKVMMEERNKYVDATFKARSAAHMRWKASGIEVEITEEGDLRATETATSFEECEDWGETSKEDNRFVMKTHATEAHGKKYNDYEVVTLLGRGKYGKVYKVKDPLGNEFAMKVLKKKKAMYGEEETDLAKVVREIEIMRKLEHPRLVRLKEVLFPHAAFEANKSAKIYIVQELCTGGQTMSNESLMDGTAVPKPPAQVWKMFRQLLNAVAYLHEKKIVHADIKPENLMMHANGNIKLIDFGQSKQSSDGDNEQDDVQSGGTPMFMAPEVLGISSSGEYSGTLADMYSVGVTLYALMFGKIPYPGPSFAQMCEQKQLPLRVSFWVSNIDRFGEMSVFSLPSPSPLGSMSPQITSSTSSKWRGKKKILDCDLVKHVPEEIDRQYKVVRWPAFNDLLQMLLHPRPFARPSAQQAKHHPWVTSNGAHPVLDVQYRS